MSILIKAIHAFQINHERVSSYSFPLSLQLKNPIHRQPFASFNQHMEMGMPRNKITSNTFDGVRATSDSFNPRICCAKHCELLNQLPKGIVRQRQPVFYRDSQMPVVMLTLIEFFDNSLLNWYRAPIRTFGAKHIVAVNGNHAMLATRENILVKVLPTSQKGF